MPVFMIDRMSIIRPSLEMTYYPLRPVPCLGLGYFYFENSSYEFSSPSSVYKVPLLFCGSWQNKDFETIENVVKCHLNAEFLGILLEMHLREFDSLPLLLSSNKKINQT